jgi:hypothetical protein
MIQPGDKVSFINDKLNGTVKRIIDKRQVLLIMDDGFEFPAAVNELVVIQKDKGKTAEGEIDESIIAETEDKSDRIYFGAVTEDTGKGQLVKCYLVNTKDHIVQFALFNASLGTIKGLSRGAIEPSRALKVISFLLSDASEYRNMVLQLSTKIIPPEEISFKLKPVSLLKENMVIPVLNQKGYLLNLSDYKNLREKEAVQDKENKELPKLLPVPDIIDLHLEEISDNPKLLQPHEALLQQMKVFNNSLEKAIAQDLPNITFIHGVGQGRLKQEIRKVLDDNPYIQRYEDADPKKFGYGATVVFLKNR